MKITDEQIKELVKFARLKAKPRFEHYEELIAQYSKDLLVYICVFLDNEINKGYNVSSYPDLYKIRMTVSGLVYEWFKADSLGRMQVERELLAIYKDLSSKSFSKYMTIVDNNPPDSDNNIDPNTLSFDLSTTLFGDETQIERDKNKRVIVDFVPSIITRSTASVIDAIFSKNPFDNTVANIQANQGNTRQIVIKAVLDYYGEDFKTFEALYL